MGLNIRGENVIVSVYVDGTAVTVFNQIKDASLTFETELQTFSFLGQTADTYDMVFNGVSGKLNQINVSDAAAIDFLEKINLAARREVIYQFNVSFTFPIPGNSGTSASTTRRATVIDAKFSPTTITVGDRKTPVYISLDFKASQCKVSS